MEEEQNDSDHSPAVPLEITAERASQVDDQLRDFAEDAELETALVVDQSGALVSGISSEEEVTIEVISALVAGACGAMRALVSELGETGGIESFHQGENRVVYLSEIIHRFVLVGVCCAGTPVGVIRETARQVRPALVELLVDLEVPEPLPEPKPEKCSFRRIAVSASSVAAMEQSPFSTDDADDAEEEFAVEGVSADELGEEPEVEGKEQIAEAEGEDEEQVAEAEAEAGEVEFEEASDESEMTEDAEEEEPAVDSEETLEEELEVELEAEVELIPEPEPVIELLDLGDPEIVIEESGSSGKAEEEESIFELEEEAEAAEAASAPLEPVDSIFELEDEPKEDVESATPAPDAGVFELDEEVEFEAAEEQDIEQSETPQIPGPIETVSENVFELEEDEEDEK